MTEQVVRSGPKPVGSVYVGAEIQGRWAVSILTEGWSDDEKQALLDGDEDAREALKEAALARVAAEPDDLDPHTYEINLKDETAPSPPPVIPDRKRS